MEQVEKKRYYDQVTAAWKLFCKYADITTEERDAGKWESLVHECEELYKQYNTNFIRKINTVMLAEIEDRARRKV